MIFDNFIKKDCKWFFAKCVEGAPERGINNAMSEHFKSQTKYTTLVRESIQNSLDAVLDKSKPVVVDFSFPKIKDPFSSMSNFMDIRKYIKGCLDYWSSNREIKKQYEPMLNAINNSTKLLSFLRVSDYNTKGMDYRRDDNNCTFYAFLRAEGTSVKSASNSGGSFGFGKMAYFTLSPIHTIMVSTMNKNGDVAFEGASMLCTNKVGGIKYMDVGYFDTNNGSPVTELEYIPQMFRRTEPGTDINIMGIDSSDTNITLCKEEIVKAVLIHFWMAVYEAKLEVKIDDIIINKNNLHHLMIKNFDNKLDDGTRYQNPRAYYEAVRGVEEGRTDCKLYSKNIEPLGSSRFYISRNRGSRDRYVAMRSPLMIVQFFNSQSSRGYSGVFICDDERGNELLRMTEPPAHDKWDKGRVQEKADRQQKAARKAITEVRNFAISCINDFFQSAEQDVTEIRGLEQLLYNSNGEQPVTAFGNQVKSTEGTPTSEYTDVENGSPITSINNPPTYSNNQSALGQVTTTFNGNISADGDLMAGKSDKKLHTRVPNPKPRSGTSHVTSKKHLDKNGNDANVERPIDVTYRCFCQNESSNKLHKLVFYSDVDVQQAVLRLKSGTADPNKMEDVPLVWSEIGNVCENRIEGIHVVKGKNVLKFRFNDDLSHTVKLEAFYEEK